MNYEALLWAAFPKADAVVVQEIGHRIGLGVQLGEYRKGISFNPKVDKVRRVIKQLQASVLADA